MAKHPSQGAAAPSFGKLVRDKFFYSPSAFVLTIVFGALAVFLAVEIFQWAVANAVWKADIQACRQASGACWGFVAEKWRLILFGRYPFEEQWRPAAALAAVCAAIVVSAAPFFWRIFSFRKILLVWAGALVVFFALMYGGIFGLAFVGTDMWGGLPLTVIITLIGMGLSSPIGIFLAIGRRSRLPIVSAVSAGYIELVRGVPLITVLFAAAFVFPLFLPPQLQLDAFWRVTIGIVLFQAAYMAETVRGGLQTVPQGQADAAESLGFTKRQAYRYVILPQALAAIIPAFINSLLSCFMDTSLVTVVSMYDLTGSLKLSLGDALWRAFFVEGYVFVALIYFASSFAASRYSQWLEAEIRGGRPREGRAD